LTPPEGGTNRFGPVDFLLHCEKCLEVVAGATHLFEEPAKLEIVAQLATARFSKHLSNSKTATQIVV
jgi:hypothetical protein